jgi:hypothetical protein
MNNESTNKIICRKCGGPHFTIKCGKEKEKEKEVVIEQTKITPPENDLPKINEYVNKQSFSKDNYSEKPIRRERYNSKITYRVKLSELPRDMSEEELMELTAEWGHIVRIKVINYDENSVAYIDFGFEDESVYFIEAIDKTPFESLLLSATRVESY